ncbi:MULTISPECIES: thioredoxin [unclassified Spirosoma]|uniref:thioredoxin n=1 Tax=unclassified Spirosoma TaxID=2621999 RepID=UPI000958E657|nr:MULTISPECIES: thioredoxin [unclassified Spirosoma]MBN8825867.1 thioredoxin [Spirosoma sp.]OJW70561.1 MAG: hypothetical protein BGO59_25360 [Spirosoma sp. 48-14]
MALTSSVFPVLPQQPILLVCTSASNSQRLDIDWLLAKLRSLVKPGIQIMCIDESTHPEVVRSFGFTSFPGCVLLQQGFELWRYAGPIDYAVLST